MKIHLIAIGGSIMHNLAICLQKAGHNVTGSDDEIYEPARSRLAECSLLPKKMGWNPEVISSDVELVILGMHAKGNNPELIRAKELQIPIVSFPEYIGQHAKNQKRVVVAGSHGKTTTTSMILHVLKYHNVDFDYLVGAQLKGFDTMVRLSDAPLIVIEGDEYLSSSIDRIPKIWHYHPQLTIVTGVAWDHMNVFPTLESYHLAFEKYFDSLPDRAKVYYASDDPFLTDVLASKKAIEAQPYQPFDFSVIEGQCVIHIGTKEVPLKIFGEHNMANLRGAYLVLRELNISEDQFIEAIRTFEGAAKRLQLIRYEKSHLIYQDFAHAPSKVKATVKAMKDQYPDRKLTACVELHTYSSLSRDFLPQYQGAMGAADQAIVFFSEHTLEMKGMPLLDKKTIRDAFAREDLLVFTKREELKKFLEHVESWENHNLLLMTSGTFEGLDIRELKTLPGQPFQ